LPAQSARPNHLEIDKALSRCASVFTKRRQRRFGELERAVKSAAKSMAQAVATEIDDRKLRSQVRASYYNQLAPMLRAVSIDRLAERVRYRKTVILAVTSSALLTSVLACLLTLSG
jgi:hypothetical protein